MRAHVGVCVSVCVCVGDRAGVRVVLLIQQATHMRHILTSFVAPLVQPYFSILSHKRHNFRKKVIEHKMCILIFSANLVYNISNSKKTSETYCHKCENGSM
jgi:hypothetical protein